MTGIAWRSGKSSEQHFDPPPLPSCEILELKRNLKAGWLAGWLNKLAGGKEAGRLTKKRISKFSIGAAEIKFSSSFNEDNIIIA